MSIEGLVDRKDKPAYVRFERVALDDPQASVKAGHYVARDVDFALITPAYSKDIFKTEVATWFENMKIDVLAGRLPEEWVERYKSQYAAWKRGEELPLNGTPIKGWGVISPAQQETLIRMTVLTVEDLADINDEGIRRIGMGALDLKRKALAWIAQLKDKGPLTVKMAAIEAENASLKNSVETLTEQVQALLAASNVQKVYEAPRETRDEGEISASDIIEPTLAQQYEAKFGRSPHHRMKESTIEAALRE